MDVDEAGESQSKLLCTYCKGDATNTLRCGFCEKPFCRGAKCTALCDVCSGSFCRTCSMISYSTQFDRTICIDCSHNLEL